MTYAGYFDGAAKPNPGEIGMGVSIINEQQQEVDWGYAYKTFGTNNEAEYLSLILLLRQALHFGITEIDCYGDSQLVIKQVHGEWSVSKEALKILNKKVVELASKFKRITFTWVPRKKNARADELSCIAIEKKQSNRKEREQVNTNKQEASVSNISPPKIKKNAITVRDLQNGSFLVIEGDQTCFINTNKLSCSCGAFLLNKKCKHITTLLNYRKQA